MAETRGSRPEQPSGLTPQPGDRKHLTRVGSLLVVVLGSLLLGAILQQDSNDSRDEQGERNEEAPTVMGSEVAIDEQPATSPPAPSAEQIAPPTTSASPEGGALTDLARRATVDFRRLPRDEAWMLQLAAICDAANVERLVQQVADRELHVLPVEIKDRACFRVCWGPFTSRAQALAAADGLPAPIRSLSEAPQPRLDASLIP